eukprot:CAMPEP_0185832458 /NCGR_PEP_ID=MMETSP1353-20130828/2094_1 /TAXON_ID=1077150 /ORGANISM="Erythrolobus australicus, Strain CCMP3124" /LENGTH=223 /DNA_ID=CAMNT_0028530633 /DNA_START=170 /DNA_END=841 /DNA_ORIENTATION=-
MADIAKAEQTRRREARRALVEQHRGHGARREVERGVRERQRQLEQVREPGHSKPAVAKHRQLLLAATLYAIRSAVAHVAVAREKGVAVRAQLCIRCLGWREFRQQRKLIVHRGCGLQRAQTVAGNVPQSNAALASACLAATLLRAAPGGELARPLLDLGLQPERALGVTRSVACASKRRSIEPRRCALRHAACQPLCQRRRFRLAVRRERVAVVLWVRVPDDK